MIQRALFYLSYPLLIFYAPVFARSRVLIIHDKEFLAVKDKFGSGRWSLPGGGVKLGETRRRAAVREVREELGLVLGEADLKTLMPYGFYRNKGLVYRGEIFVVHLSGKPVITKNREIAEVGWFKTDEPGKQFSKIVIEARRLAESTPNN